MRGLSITKMVLQYGRRHTTFCHPNCGHLAVSCATQQTCSVALCKSGEFVADKFKTAFCSTLTDFIFDKFRVTLSHMVSVFWVADDAPFTTVGHLRDGLRKWPVINLIGGGLVLFWETNNSINQITLLFGRHFKNDHGLKMKPRRKGNSLT